MPKENTTSLLDAGVKLNGSQTLSNSSGDTSFSPPSAPSRMSVLASVKIPYLRRLDVGSTAPTHKAPLLTLKLSSHSFLDSTLKDDLSSTPLYTVRTAGMTTTVVRSDPWEESTRTAVIKWPKIVPIKGKGKNVTDGVLVQLKGSRWKGGDSLLKTSTSRGGPSKFHLPNYSHSMKWHKHGTSYWCTTSPVKGPIAILDLPVDSLPARLTVYETLHDKYDTRPMLVHQGVSLLLLDYLLVTAILLVTDIQEWMVVQTPGANILASAHDPNPNTSLQWRKVVYGEPLFPKLSPTPTQYATPGGFDYNPPTPTSKEQMAKIVHGEPLYPRRQRPSSLQFSFSSDSEDEGDDYRSTSGISLTRSPNPSAESVRNLSVNASAPSHRYIDSSFYLNQPVPLLPTDHTSSISPVSTAGPSPTRTLPALPQSAVEPPRSRSTPPRPFNNTGPNGYLRKLDTSSGTIGPADASLWERRPSEPIMSRTRSMSRPLPRTPDSPSAGSRESVIRRVQSHTRINQFNAEKPWLSTPPPPLPPLPVSPLTPRTGRSLPPTPLDIAMGRAPGSARSVRVDAGERPQKSPEGEEVPPGWVQVLAGEQNPPTSPPPRPSYDLPPPAYTPIDFRAARS